MSTTCPNQVSSSGDIHTEIADLIDSNEQSFSSELGPEPPHPGDVDVLDYYEENEEPPWAWFDGELSPIRERCAAEPQNETGNGKRLLINFGDELLHVGGIGWHGWAGTHWRAEGGNDIATRCAQITAARIALEADVMTVSPSEQNLIDAAAVAKSELVAFDNISDPTSGQRSKRKRLESAIEAGAGAAKKLKTAQYSRRNFSVTSGNAPRIRGMLDQATPHRTVNTGDLDLNKLAFKCF